MSAKEILKKVYEESQKRPCADVDIITHEVLNELKKSGKEASFEEMAEFWDMLKNSTYLDELDYRFFYEDVVIE